MSSVAKWRKFSKEEIETMVSESYSIRELARKMGYAQDSGSSSKSLREMIKELNLDTTHFKGQGWNKDNYDYSSFENGCPKKGGKNTLKPLIALRGRKCENCGLTEWLGQPINLQVHHKDGNRINNSLDNLILLCPNCHSYTENFCRKDKKKIVSDEDFVYQLKLSTSICQALLHLGLTASAGNYTRARELMVKYDIHLNTEHQDGKPLE